MSSVLMRAGDIPVGLGVDTGPRGRRNFLKIPGRILPDIWRKRGRTGPEKHPFANNDQRAKGSCAGCPRRLDNKKNKGKME